MFGACRLRFALAALGVLPFGCALAFHYDGYEQSSGSADAASTGGKSGIDGGCIPTSCLTLGAHCGQLPDGCGKVLDCGECPKETPFCGGSGPNQCGTTPCTPKTCVELKAQCGDAANGCGNVINCGTCKSPAVCGAAGAPPNTCTCTPKTCADLGADCGSPDDGCGTPLSCGTCTAPNTCGGSGTANKCGPGACTPKTCADIGAECGLASNGCSGGALNCGTCASGYDCDQSNKCHCADGTNYCTGVCNTSTTNSCGETVTCGQCPNFGEVCVGNQCKLPNGGFCGADTECGSGHCSSGRCCAVDCSGICKVCSNPTYTTCEKPSIDIMCPSSAGSGGVCAALGSCACSDGVQDFGETGVDCGGLCASC